MDKREFIITCALNMAQHESNWQVILQNANSLADHLFENEHAVSKADYANDSIMVLYDELDRIEKEEKEHQRKGHPYWHGVHKKGNATRVINVARGADINTVGQLLELGRDRFEKLKWMGKKGADFVTVGLKNLYGIEKW